MSLAVTTTTNVIQSTAGAIPVRNEKGKISMQKVKVTRYISGKRPEYARSESSSSDSDVEDFVDRKRTTEHKRINKSGRHASDNDDEEQLDEIDDPRLRRLRAIAIADDNKERDRRARYRHVEEPEFLETDSEDAHSEEEEQKSNKLERKTNKITLDSESDDDADLSESELLQRRQKLRQRMLEQQKEDILQKEEEVQQSDDSETESSEYDEETESEEDHEPRLKPLFVSKRDRATIQEKERHAQRQKQLEAETKRAIKERRRATLRLVEESVKRDLEKAKPETAEARIEDVCTDDDNDEVEYEAWKLRELKRMKRDREEREK